MAANQKKILYSATGVNADTQSTPKGLEAKDDDLVFELDATKTGGTGSLDVTIQHSFDKVNWYTLVAFTQLTATGKQLVTPQLGTVPLQYVRADINIGSGPPTYSITVNAYFRKRD